MVILPTGVLTPVVEAASRANHSLGTAINIVQLILFYFLGVYAAYKHHLWRLQNLPAFKNVDDERV